MNTKHYTSIEMSKKLLELGLSPESADMVYIMFDGKPLDDDAKLSTVFESKDNKWYWIDFIDGSWDICEEDIPCWSLGALLEVVPKYIYTPKEDLGLHIFPIDGGWNFEYGYSNNSYSVLQQDKDLFNAAYNMVVWLLENAFLKKE